jgi:hypothetical protein
MPAVANALHVRLLFDIQGKLNQGCGWDYSYSGAIPQLADLNSMATALSTAVNANFQTQTASGLVYTGLTITDLSSATGAIGTATLNTTGTGGAPMPPQNCFVTSYATALRYRGGHPKTFWPLGYEALLAANGQWSTAGISAMLNAVQLVINTPVGHQYGSTDIVNHIWISYYHGHTVVTSPTTGRARNVPTLRPTPLPYLVTGVTGEIFVASQRRRRQMG